MKKSFVSYRALVIVISLVIGLWSLVILKPSPALADNALTNPQKEQIRGGAWFVQDPATWQQQIINSDPQQMDANKYGVFQITP